MKLIEVIKFYPLIILLCFLPIKTVRLFEILGYKLPNIYYNISETLLYLTGFFNSVTYGYYSYCKPILEKSRLIATINYEDSLHSNNF